MSSDTPAPQNRAPRPAVFGMQSIERKYSSGLVAGEGEFSLFEEQAVADFLNSISSSIYPQAPYLGPEGIALYNDFVLERIAEIWQEKGFLAPDKLCEELIHKFEDESFFIADDTAALLKASFETKFYKDKMLDFNAKPVSALATGLAHLYAKVGNRGVWTPGREEHKEINLSPLVIVDGDFGNMGGTNNYFRERILDHYAGALAAEFLQTGNISETPADLIAESHRQNDRTFNKKLFLEHCNLINISLQGESSPETVFETIRDYLSQSNIVPIDAGFVYTDIAARTLGNIAIAEFYSYAHDLPGGLPKNFSVTEYRSGGDEVRYMVNGLTGEQVEDALANYVHPAIERAAAHMGLHGHPHAKAPDDMTRIGFNMALHGHEITKTPYIKYHDMIRIQDSGIEYNKLSLGILRGGRLDETVREKYIEFGMQYVERLLFKDPEQLTSEEMVIFDACMESTNYGYDFKQVKRFIAEEMLTALEEEALQKRTELDITYNQAIENYREGVDAYTQRVESLRDQYTSKVKGMNITVGAFHGDAGFTYLPETRKDPLLEEANANPELRRLSPFEKRAQVIVGKLRDLLADERMIDMAMRFAADAPRDPYTRALAADCEPLMLEDTAYKTSLLREEGKEVPDPMLVAVEFSNLAGVNGELKHAIGDKVLRLQHLILLENFKEAFGATDKEMEYATFFRGGGKFHVAIPAEVLARQTDPQASLATAMAGVEKDTNRLINEQTISNFLAGTLKQSADGMGEPHILWNRNYLQFFSELRVEKIQAPDQLKDKLFAEIANPKRELERGINVFHVDSTLPPYVEGMNRYGKTAHETSMMLEEKVNRWQQDLIRRNQAVEPENGRASGQNTGRSRIEELEAGKYGTKADPLLQGSAGEQSTSWVAKTGAGPSGLEASAEKPAWLIKALQPLKEGDRMQRLTQSSMGYRLN
jgi:hypothetical protein